MGRDTNLNLADNFPYERLFGEEPKLPSTSVPGSSQERDENRAQYQNDPAPTTTSMDEAEQLDAMRTLLSALSGGKGIAGLGDLSNPSPRLKDALTSFQSLMGANTVHAEDLTDALLRLIRRTNITASQPAHNAQTLWSQPIDLSATIAVLAAAAPGTWITALSYTVQPGYAARIANYGMDVDSNYNYQGSLLWRLTVNGLAVPSLNNFAEHRGSISSPRATFFTAQEDQRITFDVQRASVGTGTNNVQMAMVGWAWRKRMNFEGTKSSVTAF